MDRVNYKALLDAGKIKDLSDLVPLIRKEVISFYQNKARWPRYTPGSEDLDLLVWFQQFELEDIMDFGTFCLVWKEMESLNKPRV